MSAPVMEQHPVVQAHGRLRAYALWQMRDYLISKGTGTVLIGCLLLFLTWTGLRTAEDAMHQVGIVQDLGPAIEAAFVQFVDKLLLFGVLFATNGIVSEDRKFGYYRFYFSKPVSAAAFYAQKFAVHVAGVVLLVVLLLGVHAWAIRPLFPPLLLPVVLLVVVGLSGIGFLVSALFTLDWISLIGVYGAALIGWILYEDDRGVRGVLVRAVPPVHELGHLYSAMVHGTPLPVQALLWIFAYGSACFGIGLVVISRRHLATT